MKINEKNGKMACIHATSSAALDIIQKDEEITQFIWPFQVVITALAKKENKHCKNNANVVEINVPRNNGNVSLATAPST